MLKKFLIICGVASVVLFNILFLDSVVVSPVVSEQQSPPVVPQQPPLDQQSPVETDPPLCGPVSLDRKLPVIALASAPRSGNTLIRHLIEESSGYITGSLYSDVRLYNTGLHGENQLLFTIVVKTHATNSTLHLFSNQFPDEFSPSTKILLLVRFPFDSIWSHFNLFHTFSHTQTLQNYTAEKFDNWVQSSATNWRDFYKYWLDEKLPRKVLRYEDLTADLCGEMAKVLDFLLPDEPPHSPSACLEEKNKSGEFKSGDRLSCAVRRNSKCSAKKECRVGAGSIGRAMNKYTEKQIQQVCDYTGQYLKLFGYPIPAQCGTLSGLSEEILNTPPMFKQINL